MNHFMAYFLLFLQKTDILQLQNLGELYTLVVGKSKDFLLKASQAWHNW